MLPQLGKEGSAALALTELCEWGRQAPVAKGPEEPQLRDAPRPGQLEEQLCVLCGGVRIFALAFGGLAGCLRFPCQGERFRPLY